MPGPAVASTLVLLEEKEEEGEEGEKGKEGRQAGKGEARKGGKERGEHPSTAEAEQGGAKSPLCTRSQGHWPGSQKLRVLVSAMPPTSCMTVAMYSMGRAERLLLKSVDFPSRLTSQA